MHGAHDDGQGRAGGLEQAQAVDAVAAGGAHSLLLGDGDDEDNLSVCGRGTCGQLGLGSGRCDVTRPTRLALGRRVVSVAAGAHHSLCVCDDGSLWAWGKASDHQLGLGNLELTVVATPTRVVRCAR